MKFIAINNNIHLLLMIFIAIFNDIHLTGSLIRNRHSKIENLRISIDCSAKNR